MEKIQRHATKMVPVLRHLQYEDRLKKQGIYSLTARRLRGNLIETFKLLHGYTNINYEIFFKLNNTRTQLETFKATNNKSSSMQSTFLQSQCY